MECREVIKKYEKVDSFLKRCLPACRYSRVRLIEPCVVLSIDYNKEFKFAVLADDSLYITENPPKLAKDVREVTKIVNVTSVELLNDVPEFLGGDLKYRAHHILITYKKDPELTSQNTAQVSRPSNHERRNSSPTATPNTSLQKDARNFVRASSLEQDIPLENEKSTRMKQKQNIPLLTYSSFEEDVTQPGKQSLHHSCSSLDHFKPKRNAKSTRLTVSANAADLKAAMDDIPDNESLATLHSGSEPNLLSSRQKGVLFSSFNGLKSFKKRMSTTATEKRAFQVSAEDFVKVEESEKSLEIHLYMLLDNTVMLAYLRSTWDNCLLNTALKQNEKGRSPNSLPKSKPNSSQVTALFDQLENEIINSKELENTFVLVNELLTACQKDVLVKKLFWQSPALFVFLVQQLKCYNSQTSEDASKMNRADELEFILLLLECLVQMFRETELLAARMTNLTTDKCRVVHELIEMIVFCSESKISKLVEPPEISEAAEVLLTGRNRTMKEPKAKNSNDIELENLSNELIRGQVALLHELFIIAYQAAWFPSVDNKLNICWMVKILESSKTIHRFLQCFVLQVMNLIKVAETGILSTDNTTFLYRLFSVLKTILQQSTKLRQHIQEYYTEEFRYYVKLHTLSKCLSKDFPLTPSTIKLVEDVTYLVTHKRIGPRHTAR